MHVEKLKVYAKYKNYQLSEDNYVKQGHEYIFTCEEGMHLVQHFNMLKQRFLEIAEAYIAGIK